MTPQDAGRQLLRLTVCHRWETMEPAGHDELMRQLGALFPHEYQASAAINYWLEHNRYLPTPADLHDLAAQFVTEETVPKNLECELCGGSGFKQDWELVTYTGRVDRKGFPISTTERLSFAQYCDLRQKVDRIRQVVCEGVIACDCRYGQFLRSKRLVEQQRKEDKRQERKRRDAA
jgi:hypothetical protein